MNLEWHHDARKMLTAYTFTLTDVEVHCLELDTSDKAVLNTPKGKGPWFIANTLQDLQLIAFRLAQQVDGSG